MASLFVPVWTPHVSCTIFSDVAGNNPWHLPAWNHERNHAMECHTSCRLSGTSGSPPARRTWRFCASNRKRCVCDKLRHALPLRKMRHAPNMSSILGRIWDDFQLCPNLLFVQAWPAGTAEGVGKGSLPPRIPSGHRESQNLAPVAE